MNARGLFKWTVAFLWLWSISFLSFGQKKQAAWWHFGDSLGLNFNANPPAIVQTSRFRGSCGSASISDSVGNLLFYADSKQLFNRFGNPMLNGRFVSDSLYNVFSLATFPSLILPIPNNGHQYCLFSIGPFDGNQPILNGGFCYFSKIDLLLDSGKGGVVPNEKKIIIADSCGGMFGAVPHTNGRDYWILVPKSRGRELRRYLLTGSGVQQLFPSVFLPSRSPFAGGEMKASPNGKKFGIIYQTDSIFIFDVNNATGELLNPIGLKIPNQSGCAFTFSFSPNSKLLYTSNCNYVGVNQNKIYQFNLNAGNNLAIQNSAVEIGSYPTIGSATSSMQLAINGKIYAGFRNDSLINAINCPDVVGLGCNFQRGAIVLPRKMGRGFFPVQNQAFFVNAFRFQAQASKDTICQGDSAWLSAYGAGAETFEWRVLGNSTVISTKIMVKVAPLQTTTYRVKGGSGCGQKDTIVTVYVVPRPKSPFGADTSICGNQWQRFTAIALPKGKYEWQSNLDTTINAKDSASVLVRFPKVEAPTPGYLFVRIQNPGCVVEDSLKLTLLPTTTLKPITTPKGDTAICQGETLVASALNPLGFGLLWSNGQTSSQIFLHQAGDYSVRILNEYNCPSDSAFQFSLTVHPLPITQTLANNKKDTTICFPASLNLGINPQNNVSYQWQGSQTDSLSNSQISNPIFQFANRDTLVKTFDFILLTFDVSTGCRNQDSLTLKLVPFLRPDAGADKQFCSENQSLIGKKGFAGFAYSWSPNVGITSPQSAQTQTNLVNPGFENILSQRYIRTVSLLGCAAKDTLEVQVYPQVPKPVLSGPQFVCPGVLNVPYQLSTLPAISSFQFSTFHFQLSGGDSTGRFLVNWGVENPNASAKIKLGNVYGCQPDSVSLPVNVTRNLRPQTLLTPGINDSLCLVSAQNVGYRISPFNPQSRYTWRFNPDQVQSVFPTVNSQLSTFNLPGIYTLTLTESDTTPIAQCFGETEYKVRIWPQPTAKAIVGKDSVCHLASEQFSMENGQWNSQYSWVATKGSIENQTPHGGRVNYSADFELQTDYETIAIRNRETSDKGCLGPENSKTIVVESLPKPTIMPPTQNLEWKSLENRRYEASGRPGSSFQWQAENGNIVSGQGSSKVEIDWLPNQLRYRLKVQEISRIGCLGESDFLSIPYDSALFIPNLITHNGDRKNDQLFIQNLHFYPQNELSIFDRWGRKVFEAGPYQQDWPKERLSNGLYFFSFSAGDNVLKGWVLVAE